MSKKETILTVENGKLNRRWFNNRVLNGTITVYEKNMKNDDGYKKLDSPKNLLSMMRICDDGKRIVGYLGTSFYYKFTIQTV